MTDRDDCRFRDDVGPWVLGALTEPDAAAFAAHLETCPACRREVAELQPVADVLPMAAPRVVPPSEASTRRIMSVVDAEAELSYTAAREADRPPEAPRRGRGRGRAGRPGRFGRVRPVPAAVLATALLAIGVVGGVLATGGDTGTTTFTGTSSDGAEVALRVADHRGVLAFQKLPEPPAGRVYEVWLVTGKDRPRATHALFSVSRDGRASVAIPESLKGANEVLVSDEPPSGSAHPTGHVVASASLS